MHRYTSPALATTEHPVLRALLDPFIFVDWKRVNNEYIAVLNNPDDVHNAEVLGVEHGIGDLPDTHACQCLRRLLDIKFEAAGKPAALDRSDNIFTSLSYEMWVQPDAYKAVTFYDIDERLQDLIGITSLNETAQTITARVRAYSVYQFVANPEGPALDCVTNLSTTDTNISFQKMENISAGSVERIRHGMALGFNKKELVDSVKYWTPQSAAPESAQPGNVTFDLNG